MLILPAAICDKDTAMTSFSLYAYGMKLKLMLVDVGP
jgi:hypothetical protein